MKSYQGTVIEKPLEHWRPLLKEWISLMEKYCSVIPENPLYCHLERANVSLLASAAWRIGWLAVQELWIEKRSHKQSSFCDLWLRPNSTEEGEYIEAKIKWSIAQTEPWLSRADYQIKNIKIHEQTIHKISICFIVPSIHKHSNIDKEIEENIKGALKIQYNALAWCFPKKTRTSSCKDDENINPGIFLFARMIE